jgi:hypothetical protein
MTLAEAKNDSVCRIGSINVRGDRELLYLANGLRAGADLTVVCRHPAVRPRVIEVRLDNQLHLSVPVDIAEQVTIGEPGPKGVKASSNSETTQQLNNRKILKEES